MIGNMKTFGFDITLEELEKEAGGELIGRPHFAHLFARKGYVSCYQEAFDKYLDKGKPLYLNKKRLPPQKAIKLLRNAGGIPVIAHPYQTRLVNDELEELIVELTDFGLMGIEVFYSQHTPEQIRFYKYLADKYGLLITAGSDFHGSTKPDIELGMNVEDELLQPFLQKGNKITHETFKKKRICITSFAEGLTCLVGLIMYLSLNKAIDWTLAPFLVFGGILSVPLAGITVKMNTDKLRLIIAIVTIGLGLLTLGKIFIK